MQKDRFEKISDNYAQLANEVWEVQGLNYQDFQKSVFDAVRENIPNFKNRSILDIGVGDGETSARFVENGCTNVVGLDLNPTMLKQSKKRFGNKIKLVHGDARDLSRFRKDDFYIIISATTIHNVPTSERLSIWSELKRLDPELIVMADKITDPNPKLHKQKYDSEIKALNLVFWDRYGLEEQAREWVKHYGVDEEERLEIEEIKANLGSKYNIEITLEMGMNKTVVCRRK